MIFPDERRDAAEAEQQMRQELQKRAREQAESELLLAAGLAANNLAYASSHTPEWHQQKAACLREAIRRYRRYQETR